MVTITENMVEYKERDISLNRCIELITKDIYSMHLYGAKDIAKCLSDKYELNITDELVDALIKVVDFESYLVVSGFKDK